MSKRPPHITGMTFYDLHEEVRDVLRASGWLPEVARIMIGLPATLDTRSFVLGLTQTMHRGLYAAWMHAETPEVSLEDFLLIIGR